MSIHLLQKNSEAFTNLAIDKEQALIAQIDLNSRLQDQKKVKYRDIHPTRKQWSPREYYTRQVLDSLLQSGIAGDKIERSEQSLKSIQKNERVSIVENNQNIVVDQQDTTINIIDFVTALQVNTKQLAKQFLILVEILALPQLLLANTYSKQTGYRIQSGSVNGESPRKRIKLDTDHPNKWLTIWV